MMQPRNFLTHRSPHIVLETGVQGTVIHFNGCQESYPRANCKEIFTEDSNLADAKEGNSTPKGVTSLPQGSQSSRGEGEPWRQMRPSAASFSVRAVF